MNVIQPYELFIDEYMKKYVPEHEYTLARIDLKLLLIRVMKEEINRCMHTSHDICTEMQPL